MTNPDPFLSFTPPQMLEKASSAGIKKANLAFWPTFLLAILAGAYIAFGGVFATVVATGTMESWPYGIVKLVQGLVFSLGLILVVVGGAELFTGNILMVIPLLQKKIRFSQLIRNWFLVYTGNFIGSIVIAGLIIAAGSYHGANGTLGTTMIRIAESKLQHTFLQALSLGILCNILVCLAVWLCYSARSTADKILAIVFPISAFIAAGFEHSVANMYLLPVALFLKNFDPSFLNQVSLDLSNLNWTHFLVNNLLPVTIGNIIGGGLFVGIAYFLAYGHQPGNNDTKQ